ncbi:phage replisome organizer N-terminal domain-containing protein [Halobacillus ihumii]|uniref:phage replisome organizer N-terminal domain-containing protein n=1 Tax=Halobacillus ihumii TaxID=2686092 RepID=UPI0013D61BCE|nr:phage replisome organizer N-terminal domain-containing protein [Halobacillus ihumii]
MSEVKWIKLNTHMFEDEKIKLIEQMPDADTLLVIWIKLIAQAGKVNASGYIFLSERIPYSDEMLATIFNRPINTVRMALDTFQQFGMIHIDDKSFIRITNWEKHQNIAGLEKIREQNRKRVAKHRQKKKLEQPKDDVTLHVTQGNAPEEEQELERELDIDKEKEQLQEQDVADVIQFWDVNGFGLNNTNAKHQLLSWLDDSNFQYPKEMIIKALEIACANNKRRLNYVEGILRNWENESLLTAAEVDQAKGSKGKSQNGYDPDADAF